MSSLEAVAGNISFKVRIVTVVENSVIFTLAVKFDNEFEMVEFIGQLM